MLENKKAAAADAAAAAADILQLLLDLKVTEIGWFQT